MADPTVLTSDMVAAIQLNRIVELVEGVMYGMEALLAGVVCFILWNQVVKSWSRCLLVAATLMMFVDSTIAVIGDIRYLAIQYQAWVDPSIDIWPTLELWNALIAVFCRISYFLGDIIVIWRAWVLYQRNIVIKLILSACAVLSLGCAIYDTVAAIDINLSDNVFTSTRFLLPAAVIFINALTTLLIAYRAWEHRVFIKTHLENTSAKSQVMQCLVLLIESGALYCIFWIMILLSMTVERFDNTAGPYLNVILPHMESIYPTTIILLTALKKTHCDSTLQTAEVTSRSLRFATAHNSQLSQSIRFAPRSETVQSLDIGSERVENNKSDETSASTDEKYADKMV